MPKKNKKLNAGIKISPWEPSKTK